MSDTVLLAVAFSVFQVINITYLMRQIMDLQREIDRLEKGVERSYKSHRDSYHELNRKHENLIEALDICEVRGTPTHYAKKGNV